MWYVSGSVLFKMKSRSSWLQISTPRAVVSCGLYQSGCFALKSPPRIRSGSVFNAWSVGV